MFKKGTKSYSIFNLKCPRCHEGETFKTGSYSFVKPIEMHERCPKCDLNYFPEPGYYYGAMFISYIVVGWFCLLFMGLFFFGLGWDQNLCWAMLVVFLAVNFIYIFRVSRLMWININVRYDPNAIEKAQTRRAQRATDQV
jgi:uncharacterized protein (DUF983 family)